MKNKKGFTLIELLAVIVILAIIALIAVPVIMNIINKANKSAFKDTVYGVISAGELYFSEQLLDVNGMDEDKTFDFEKMENSGLQIKGQLPQSGSMIVNKEGKVAIAASNGRYCVTKGFDDTDVTVTENSTGCEIPATLIANPNPYISSEDDCVKYDKICPNGTLVHVTVNNSEINNFYVINDTGTRLTLIMDRNIISNITWNATSAIEFGPIDALVGLQNSTETWTNLSEMNNDTFEIYYPDTASTEVKKMSDSFTMYARLPKYDEIRKIYNENKSLPTWLTGHLKDKLDDFDVNPKGYWTSTRVSENSHNIWAVGESQYQNNDKTIDGAYRCFDSDYGVRPVIEISK